LDDKYVIVFSDNERKGTTVAKVLTEKGFENIYLLSGGIQ
jgi:rhodanese-related sulfurtransferase